MMTFHGAASVLLVVIAAGVLIGVLLDDGFLLSIADPTSDSEAAESETAPSIPAPLLASDANPAQLPKVEQAIMPVEADLRERERQLKLDEAKLASDREELDKRQDLIEKQQAMVQAREAELEEDREAFAQEKERVDRLWNRALTAIGASAALTVVNVTAFVVARLNRSQISSQQATAAHSTRLRRAFLRPKESSTAARAPMENSPRHTSGDAASALWFELVGSRHNLRQADEVHRARGPVRLHEPANGERGGAGRTVATR
jgi:hypothetical protein